MGACNVLLQRTPKFRRRNTGHAPEDLREMARVLVADVEADLDQAVLCLADELLGARDPLMLRLPGFAPLPCGWTVYPTLPSRRVRA